MSEQLVIIPEMNVETDNPPTVAAANALYHEAVDAWHLAWRSKPGVSWLTMTLRLIDLDRRYLNPATTNGDAAKVCEASIAEARTGQGGAGMSTNTCLWHDMDIVDADTDDAPVCPDCDDELVYWSGHFQCQNFECSNRKWYSLVDGTLTEMPRRLVRKLED